jgi:hypothetical protein
MAFGRVRKLALLAATAATIARSDIAWADATPECNPGMGANSTECGSGSIATGIGATAIGAEAMATADLTTAVGHLANGSAIGAQALGYEATAKGELSLAAGYEAEASNSRAVAVGPQAVASGDSSTALGNVALAAGRGGNGARHNTRAEGMGAVAIGVHANAAGLGAFSGGVFSTASGSLATATGARRGSIGRSVNGYRGEQALRAGQSLLHSVQRPTRLPTAAPPWRSSASRCRKFNSGWQRRGCDREPLARRRTSVAGNQHPRDGRGHAGKCVGA